MDFLKFYCHFCHFKRKIRFFFEKMNQFQFDFAFLSFLLSEMKEFLYLKLKTTVFSMFHGFSLRGALS